MSPSTSLMRLSVTVDAGWDAAVEQHQLAHFLSLAGRREEPSLFENARCQALTEEACAACDYYLHGYHPLSARCHVECSEGGREFFAKAWGLDGEEVFLHGGESGPRRSAEVGRRCSERVRLLAASRWNPPIGCRRGRTFLPRTLAIRAASGWIFLRADKSPHRAPSEWLFSGPNVEPHASRALEDGSSPGPALRPMHRVPLEWLFSGPNVAPTHRRVAEVRIFSLLMQRTGRRGGLFSPPMRRTHRRVVEVGYLLRQLFGTGMGPKAAGLIMDVRRGA